MADKKKFSKAPSQKQKFKFMGLEPKMKFKGNPYESLRDIDTEVDMKDMTAVFGKGDEDGFTNILVGPERIELRVKKSFLKVVRYTITIRIYYNDKENSIRKNRIS
jgi:hypothetical protein